MCTRREKCAGELLRLLQKLKDSWGADGSATSVPSPLSDLLDLTKVAASPPPASSSTSAPAPPTHQVPPHTQHDDDAGSSGSAVVAVSQMSLLLDVARLALSSNSGGNSGRGAGTAPPKARSRALSLDCLRLGLFQAGQAQGFERDALAIAAVGANDERWEVRVAAARAAGEAMRSWGRTETLGLLSSKQGCWLPAMLVDGYPEVEAAARAAVSPGPVCAHASDDEIENSSRCQPQRTASIPPPSSAETPPSAVAPGEAAANSSAAAVLRGACEVLRAATAGAVTLSPERENDGSAKPRFVDLAEEETMRTALRALRGGVSLLRSRPRDLESRTHSCSCPPVQHQQRQQQQQQEEEEEEEKQVEGGMEEEATVVRVEALELVEAWLARTLTSPPDASVPWAEEEAQSAAASSASAVPGGSLSLEARDAVRALLFGQAQDGLFRGTALEAAAAVVEECRLECSRSAVGGWGREAAEEWEEDSWRRVYCALLVRLELCFQTTSSGEGLSTKKPSTNGSVAAAEQPDTGRGGGVGAPVNTAAAAADLASFIPLTETLAGALEEVPFAHEQAVPPYLDQDHDDNRSVREKKALRAQGSRRRHWMVCSSHLLLRAGARLCERPVASTDAAASGESEERSTATARVKLLTVALPFRQATTRSDDPTTAWLSCVHNNGIIPNSAPTATTSAADPKATAVATAELTTPIPWDYCLRRQELPRHELPAPWASDPATVKLAARLVDAAWSALSLDAGGPAAERHAEALVQVLRAAARARGGWRDKAGVGIKHAVSAAVRRLRFPLVAGATLGHALPLVLPLADDHDPAHQAVGFSLLLHLGAQASPTELGWHRGLLLEVLERGLRGGNRDPSTSALCLAATVRLLRGAPRSEGASSSSSNCNSPGRAGIRVAREALRQAASATDGVVKVVMVRGAAALLELPATGEGYAPCEFLRPALLCLLPILQSSPVSTRLDARAASLRAVHALCLSCWPRVHAHASKLLCALLWACGDCARRASVRKSGGDGAAAVGLPLGVVLAANHSAIDASTDEAVREHATRLGALVLLLAGDTGGGSGGSTNSSARAALRQICAAVSVLRPAGVAMEELADRALSLEEAARGDGQGEGRQSEHE